MANFKLLISDVDGTLTGRDMVVSKQVEDAVSRWKKAGKLFTVASGRQHLMLKHTLKDLDLSIPVIVRGGAEIVDPKNEKVIYSNYIDGNTVKKFIIELNKNSYDFMVGKGDSFYSTTPTVFSHTKKRYPFIKVKKLEELEYKNVPKINVPLGNRKIEEFESFARELSHKFPQLNIVRSYNEVGKTLDVTSEKATKHLAALELIKLLGLTREEVVGVGDGYNDFPLLEACGLKVAMGNANDELKQIADMVVPSQKDDGVAYLIDKLLAAEGEPRPKGRE